MQGLSGALAAACAQGRHGGRELLARAKKKALKTALLTADADHGLKKPSGGRARMSQTSHFV